MSTDSTLKNSPPKKAASESPKNLPPKGPHAGQAPGDEKILPLESAPPPTELEGIPPEARQEPRPTNAEFDGSEEHMAERLGLSREHLVLLRQKHLTEGVEFERKDRSVRYHKAGAEKLLKLMALPPEALQALIRAALPPLPPIGKACKVIVRRMMSHRSVVEGYLPGMDPNDGRSIVRIRVRGNIALYTRGMELPCVRVSDDLFECTAPAPRWKGKW